MTNKESARINLRHTFNELKGKWGKGFDCLPIEHQHLLKSQMVCDLINQELKSRHPMTGEEWQETLEVYLGWLNEQPRYPETYYSV